MDHALSDRDEITEIIDRRLSEKCAFALGDNWPYEVAEAILAAGYRKPRVVAALDELEALPGFTIAAVDVPDSEVPGRSNLLAVQKDPDGTWWVGDDQVPLDVLLSALVLHEPEETV